MGGAQLQHHTVYKWVHLHPETDPHTPMHARHVWCVCIGTTPSMPVCHASCNKQHLCSAADTDSHSPNKGVA